MPYIPSAAIEAANQATYDLRRAFELYSATVARQHFEAAVLRVTTKEMPPPRPRQTSMGSPSGTRSTPSYPAYRLVAGALVPDTLSPINGQTFEEAATPWELNWSSLCKGGGSFTPVVSQPGSLAGAGLATVSGHHGAVTGRDLIRPAARVGDETVYGDQLFVHGRGEKVPAGWARYGVDDDRLVVYVAVDGEVLGILSATNRESQAGATRPAIDPIDLAADIISGRLLVRLSRGGSVHLSSVSVRKGGGRTALTGPTAQEVAKVAARAADEAADALKYTTYSRRMGIPKKHFDAMVAAAKETDSVVVFRANKEVAIELIEKGAVGKPKALSLPEFKSDAKTGVLTASKPEQFALIGRNPDYYLVNGKGEVGRMVVRDGKEVYETINVHPAYWDLQFGQVIHKSGHPVVGDYDLMGVLPVKSPGSAAVGVPKDGLKGDWLGPHVEAYMKKLNPKLDKPRVLHGAQDQYHGDGGGLDDGLAYAVFPDGRAVLLNGRVEQAAFYKRFKRQTPGGSYNPNLPDVPVTDELAARRGKKK